MANSTANPHLGACAAPFLDASTFPDDQGYVAGRFCATITILPGDPTCCIPCPAPAYIYDNSLDLYNKAAAWLSVIGLVLMSFMLISYCVLPVSQTRSHYLSICLIVSIIMMALGFTIPLGADPDPCANAITPNDMYSSIECAFSGAFIVAGGLCTTVWIFLRALSMNLQICWDIVPGRRFFYLSQLAGWGIPAVLFTITMAVTGVSFRFGGICSVNHSNSMGDFWAPLLIFAGAAGILQVITFVYCLHVYLKNLWTDTSATSTNASGSALPSYNSSLRTQTARAVWQRLKKVLWLQWRGLVIVSIILADVLFFSIAFVHLNALQSKAVNDWEAIEPWLFCLVENPASPDKCLPKLDGWILSESIIVAVLMLISCAGLQAFLLLTRPSIFPAWGDYIRSKFITRQEFVSLDARTSETHSPEQLKVNRGGQSATFEMQTTKEPHIVALNIPSDQMDEPDVSSPEEVYRSPLQNRESGEYDFAESMNGYHEAPPPVGGRSAARGLPGAAGAVYHTSGLQRQTSNDYGLQRQTSNNNNNNNDYFRQSRSASQSGGRRYNPPNSSFSGPKPPSRPSSVKSVSFDHRDTYSRGGLGLNPPDEESESDDDMRTHMRRL